MPTPKSLEDSARTFRSVLRRSAAFSGFPRGDIWYKYQFGNFPAFPKSYSEMHSISDSEESLIFRAHFPHCVSPARSVCGHSPDSLRYKYSLGELPTCPKSYPEMWSISDPKSLEDPAHTFRNVFRTREAYSETSRADVGINILLRTSPSTRNSIRKCGQFPIPQSLEDSARTPPRIVFRQSELFSDTFWADIGINIR